MRLISFSMTEGAFVAGTKTVTRRLGWTKLTPGTRLMAVNKAMGLKRGEKPRRLGEIEVARFCKAMGCKPDWLVTRIEFRKVGAS